MSPMILLGGLALAGLGYAVFSKKEPPVSPEERLKRMVALADIIYRLSIHKSSPEERQRAVGLAKYFQLPKTAMGIGTAGGALPNDEKWPGTEKSVALYMKEYADAQKPKPAPAPGAPPKPKYNDEVPIPPFEDPRKIRAQAVAAEARKSPAEAKVLHAKANLLNNLIKAAKTKNAAVSAAKGAGAAVKSLGNLFAAKK